MVAPVYLEKADRSYVASAIGAAFRWRDAVTAYHEKNRRLPSRPEELGPLLPPAGDAEGYGTVTLGTDGSVILTLTAKLSGYAGETVLFKPDASSGKLAWDCTGGTLKAKVRPNFCR